MAGFEPSRPTTEEPRDLPVERFNARLGLVLFAIYLLGYGAYVLVNAFRPGVMDEVVLGNLNVAVVSGMLLIVGALGLALVYAWFCRKPGGAPR